MPPNQPQDIRTVTQAELKALIEAARTVGQPGWSVFDSHFFDWLRDERVQPESIALLRTLVCNATAFSRHRQAALEECAAILADHLARQRALKPPANNQCAYLEAALEAIRSLIGDQP